MTKGMLDKEEKRAGVEDNTMLGRVSQPEEQAPTVIFFLSDKASCELNERPRHSVTNHRHHRY